MTGYAWLSLSDSAWVERIGWALLHSLWLGAVVAAVLAVALKGLRRFAPEVRYAVSCGALILAAGLPALAFFIVPVDSAAGRPSAEEAGTAAEAAVVGAEPSVAFAKAIGGEDGFGQTTSMPLGASRSAAPTLADGRSPLSSRSAWAESFRAVIPGVVATWLVGVLLMSARLFGSCLRVRRLRTRGAVPAAGSLAEMLDRLRARLGVSRAVVLLESALVEVPTVFGWLRPVILLPATAVTGLPASQIEAILAHELAHIRRCDYLVNFVQTAVETLLFYHPAVWWISAQVRRERENCCDDMAISVCGDRREYATALLRLEELRPAPAVALAARGGDLLGRVRRLAGQAERDRLPAWWGAGLIALCVAAAPLAILRAAPEPTATDRVAPEAVQGEPARPDLVGTITEAEGKPVAGATVFIYSAGVRSGTNTLCPSCYPDCAKRVATDMDGRFSIPSLDPELLLRVLVAADGYEPTFATKVDPLAGRLDVSVKARPVEGLDPKLTIRGRVVDHEGKPVLGAVLSPRGVRRDRTTRFGGNAVDAVAVTNADGEFLFAAQEAFDAAAFLVEARGFANEVSPEFSAGSSDGRIELGTGCVVTGRLLRDGKPVAGAKVGLVQENRRSATFLGPKEIGTDANGVFLFDNVGPDESYALYGMIDSLPAGGATEAMRIVTGFDGVSLDVGNIEVIPARTLAGRVVLADGTPVPPDTRIGLYRETAWDTSGAVIDTEGRFALRGVHGEPVSLGLRVPGFHFSTKNKSFLPIRGNLTGLVDRDRDDLLILLEPGEPEFRWPDNPQEVTEGFERERWLKGEPLEGAPANWKEIPEPDLTLDRVNRTHFRPKTAASTASPADLGGDRAPLLPSPSAAAKATPTSSGGGSTQPADAIKAEGVVHDGEDRPITGALVRLFRSDGFSMQKGEEVGRLETGGDGRFRFRDLPVSTEDEAAVTYVVVVTKAGLSSAVRHVPIAGRLRELDVSLLTPALLRGRVLDERNNGVEGVVVHRYGFGGDPVPGLWTAVSGEKGYYEITDLPPWRAGDEQSAEPGLGFPTRGKDHRMVFYARKPGYAKAMLSYGELPATIDVNLSPAAILEGRVLDAVTGEPIRGARVTAEGIEVFEDGGARIRVEDSDAATTDADGRYRLDALAGGKYNLWARLPGHVVAPIPAVPAPARKTTTAPDLVFTEGALVTGRVVDVETGEPVSRTSWGSRIRIAASSADVRGGPVLESVPVADDGTFRSRVPPGRCSLYVQLEQDIRDRSIRSSQSVTVKDGETAELPSFKIRVPKATAEEARPGS